MALCARTGTSAVLDRVRPASFQLPPFFLGTFFFGPQAEPERVSPAISTLRPSPFIPGSRNLGETGSGRTPALALDYPLEAAPPLTLAASGM